MHTYRLTSGALLAQAHRQTTRQVREGGCGMMEVVLSTVCSATRDASRAGAGAETQQ